MNRRIGNRESGVGRYIVGWAAGRETDYVVSGYPPTPHTIHPPHQIATILEESEIVLRSFRITYYNIVSLLHGIA